MNPAIMAWLFFRAARWLLWFAFFAVGFYVSWNRDDLLTGFGHLPLAVDIALFGLGNAAVFAGFMELMMRERAGIPRPKFGELIPAKRRSSR